MSIRIRSLTKFFEEQIVLNNLSLDIPMNETTILTGRSGCGKTTLLRIIAGLDDDYTGEVAGVPLRISYMFQEDRLLPWLTLRENIAFVLRDIMEKEEIDRLTLQMIKSVRLVGHESKYPDKLSGGMKRRVAMARAFCYPAELLLMDEPFKGFDAQLKQDMIALYKKLYVQTNKTAIIVTHDLDVIESLDCNVIEIG